MGRETCSYCHGAGQIRSSEFESCYACGGRGYGATTDTPCMACGGGGRSTTPKLESCWQCGGAGSVATPDPPSPPRQSSARGRSTASRQAPSGKARASESTWAPSESVVGAIGVVALIAAALAAVGVHEERADVGASLLAGLLAGGTTYIALFAVYYVVRVAWEVAKIALVIAFWGAIAVFAGHALGFEWAEAFVAALKAP